MAGEQLSPHTGHLTTNVTEVITSTHNSGVAAAAKLHKTRERARSGKSLLEGAHLLDAALSQKLTVGPIFALPDDRQTADLCNEYELPLTLVTRPVLGRIAATVHPKGPIAVFEIPPFEELTTRETLVLAGVADPGNAGALIRSAAAFGFQVAIALNGVDIWSPRVLRAGVGAHFLVRLADLGDDPVSELTKAGLSPQVTVSAGGSWPPPRSQRPAAIIVGNEAHGVDPQITAVAVQSVTIPLAPGVESLNASVAGSLVMYELAWRRSEDSR